VHRSMLRGPVVCLHFLERPTVHKPAVLLSQERTPTALTKHLRPRSSNGVQGWVHPTTNTRASTASKAKRVRDDDSSVRGSPARPLWDGRPALWHRQPRDSCSLPQLGPGVCSRVPQRRAVDKAGEPHVCRVVQEVWETAVSFCGVCVRGWKMNCGTLLAPSPPIRYDNHIHVDYSRPTCHTFAAPHRLSLGATRGLIHRRLCTWP
jgi:hypothetical protein